MKRNILENNTIGITGGAGLIGSYLVEHLVNQGYKVVAIDDLSKGSIKNIEEVIEKIEFRKADLQNYGQAKDALEGVDIIFHLASRAYGVGYSVEHHLEMIQHNEQITNNLIKVFQQKPPDHILITSSSCVYRDNGPNSIPESDSDFGEPEYVNRGYGWAKRFMEKKFALLSDIKKIPLTTVRPFNIYGERSIWVGSYSGAIPMLVKRILDQEDPLIAWGSGKQRRNYLHAFDCARVMARLVELNHTGSPINIGLNETISIAELVNIICKLSSNSPEIIFDKSKPEGRFIKSSDTMLLQEVLGDFRIETIGIEEGISRMIDWYKRTF